MFSILSQVFALKDAKKHKGENLGIFKDLPECQLSKISSSSGESSHGHSGKSSHKFVLGPLYFVGKGVHQILKKSPKKKKKNIESHLKAPKFLFFPLSKVSKLEKIGN